MVIVENLSPKGYCAGVKYAIALALKSKEENPTKDVYVFGRLVHNNEVINFLESKGIKTLIFEKKNAVQTIRNLPKKSILVFPAHGHNEALDLIAKENDIEIVDAVCPKVKQNNSIIKNEIKNGHQVIFLGISNHPETDASISIDENVILFDVNKEFDYSKVSDNSPLIVNQTTLNYVELSKMHEEIKKHLPNGRIQNEICNSTRIRQENIVNLKDDVDLILIVGDPLSSNTNRLLDVSKQFHRNIESKLISNVGQISKEEIINKKHIVISSGASTPIETINMIYSYIVNCFSK